MKWRDILKGMVIGVFIAAMALSLGRCTRSAEAATSDWKLCNTKLVIANNTTETAVYSVYWIDHDLELEGQADKPMPRCGGEIEGRGIHQMSTAFRLCPGHHSVVWKLSGNKEMTLMFVVTPDIKQIVVTPEKVFKKYDNFYKPPEMKNVSFTEDNISDIYQALRENFSAFAKVAKTTYYRKTAMIHTGQGVGDTFYAMSLNLTKDGILLSIDFTKQVTRSEDKVDIYYEGIRSANGNKYYCYAKKLHRDLNYDQTPIPAESIFKQVVKVLFEDRKEV